MRPIQTLLIAISGVFHATAIAAPGDELFQETSHQADFKAVSVAEGLSIPWGLDFLPGGGMIVTEWTGAVRLIRDGIVSAPLEGGPALFTHPNGRTLGMLDVALHPDHVENKLGIKLGESTDDGRIYLKREEECLAACCGAPMMMVDHKYHENLTTDQVDDILDGLD